MSNYSSLNKSITDIFKLRNPSDPSDPSLNFLTNYKIDGQDFSFVFLKKTQSSIKNADIGYKIQGTDLSVFFEPKDPLYNLPTGTILIWSGETTPLGYFKCDGTSYSKTSYGSLYNIIGYTYGGSGDNFNVPNFSDYKRAYMNTNYAMYSGGNNNITLTDTPVHNHTSQIVSFDHKHPIITTQQYSYRLLVYLISPPSTETDTSQTGNNVARINSQQTTAIPDSNNNNSYTFTGGFSNVGSSTPQPLEIKNPYIGIYYIIKYL